ncbi:MAG: hemerythrin domain-containing protein [Acidimicrobiales bacterium]|nr:hemerythrin domain-containing protein [Acidimicrobiales bacterium]
MSTTFPAVDRTVDPSVDFAAVTEAIASGRVPVAPTFAVDLYRDIHKGIRAELFAITMAAGDADPLDRAARAALAAHVTQVAGVLESHAHHEDAHVDEPLRAVAPELAERVDADHHRLEADFAAAAALAGELVGASGTDRRGGLQLLHLQLSAFTADYLRHQLTEERVVMPRLAEALGPEDLGAINGAIISSIPPDEMAMSLSFMLPAMNADDRAELLGAMRAGAPAEVFEGVMGLARTVLDPAELRATRDRLGR